MRVIELEQGSPEWLEWRRTKSMASETPAVMGLSPWQSPLMVAESKLNGAQMAQNAAMLRGIEREPIVRERVSKDWNIRFEPAVVEDEEYGASLDGIDLYDDVGRTILEIKSPVDGTNSRLYHGALQHEVPEHYLIQVQHQLMVSGAGRCLFVVDGGGASYALTEILPDPSLQKVIRHAWVAFWRTLAHGALPEPSDLDTVLRDDPAWAMTAQRFVVAKHDLEIAQKDADAAKKALIALSAAPRSRGAGVLVTRFKRAGRVQYGKVPVLEGMDLDEYRSPASDEVRVTVEKETT